MVIVGMGMIGASSAASSWRARALLPCKARKASGPLSFMVALMAFIVEIYLATIVGLSLFGALQVGVGRWMSLHPF